MASTRSSYTACGPRMGGSREGPPPPGPDTGAAAAHRTGGGRDMTETRYLIVGGGMTGHAAAAAIREADPEGRVTMLAAEEDRPYARPPLSKGLWLGKPEESVWLPEVAGLDLRTGRRAVALDLRAREVRDDRGETYRYERLLLATGGAPRRLPFGGDRVSYLRTLADYRRLRALQGRRVVVIGGGFIGSEIAASLAATGKEVTMIFPE